LNEGGSAQLIIPPDLGYGPNDYNDIPGGSTLYFDVTLLEITPAE
jgi:FKBP-type peptidyl-prolyl cis-trans isomerase